MNIKVLIFFSLVIISCSTVTEQKNKEQKPVINEKEFLNHEIINDSIVVRIKEFNERNSTYRNLCVFKNDKVFREHLIYKIKKKEILDDGYNQTKKKDYKVKDKNLVEVFDYTFHYFDYNIDHIDTNYSQVMVSADGEISVIN